MAVVTDTSVQKLAAQIDRAHMDGALVSSYANVRYYSGFTGSNGMLLVHKTALYLLTDFRYIEQGKLECPEFEVIDAPGDKAVEFIRRFCSDMGLRSLWFEDDHMTFKAYKRINDVLNGVELVPDSAKISRGRMVKTGQELSYIRRAAAFADQGFDYISGIIQPGVTEREIALELEIYLRRNGSTKAAFDIIVASGQNAALPHAQPSDRAIRAGEPVILDFGCVVNGYRSDMTRTVSLGKAAPAIVDIYRVVLEAQNKALDGIKAGMMGMEVDRIARRYIEQSGYGSCFGHGLGHGVGLKIHEAPTLSESGMDVLEPGMVVTVEPGIYLPGVGGVRIEDMVIITEDGIENLTASPKGFELLNGAVPAQKSC